MRDRWSLFLDTSVWIAAILSDRGASFALLQEGRASSVAIVSSPDVFDEAVRNFVKKYPERVRDFWDAFDRVHPLLVTPSTDAIRSAARIIHPDDALILAGALAAEADALVTLDKKHFLQLEVLTRVPIEIVTPAEALQQLRQSRMKQ